MESIQVLFVIYWRIYRNGTKFVFPNFHPFFFIFLFSKLCDFGTPLPFPQSSYYHHQQQQERMRWNKMGYCLALLLLLGESGIGNQFPTQLPFHQEVSWSAQLTLLGTRKTCDIITICILWTYDWNYIFRSSCSDSNVNMRNEFQISYQFLNLRLFELPSSSSEPQTHSSHSMQIIIICLKVSSLYFAVLLSYLATASLRTHVPT